MLSITKYFALFALVAAWPMALVHAAPTTSLAPRGTGGHSFTFYNEANYQGTSQTLVVQNGVCTQISGTMDNAMQSVAKPRGGFICVVYADPGCANHAVIIGKEGSTNMFDSSFAQNGVSSVMCATPAT